MSTRMSAPIDSFDTFLEQQLNKSQRAAVEHDQGPLIVIAGAGSGKTRVITTRIINLIVHKKVDPRSILALTFTNKAARQMNERVQSFLSDEVHLPFIGTFHSYCLRMLKTNLHLLGISSFSILDDDDQHALLNKIIKHLQMDTKISARELTYTLSAIKSAYALGQEPAVDPRAVQIYHAYEKEKSASNCFDFDDLIIEVLKLFTKHASFKERFHNDIRHILIDEYQDTNRVQHALIKAMATGQDNQRTLAIASLCVVGDEDQSIYSWRGATIDNMLNFKHDFPDTQLVTIEQNYRSVAPILDLANQVIAHNSERHPKQLWSDKKGANRIKLVSCMSGYQESELIAQCAAHAGKVHRRSDCAILYRTHYQSRVIEEALIRHSIPYHIVGGIQFYERKEVKDILAYVRLLVNPFDRVAWYRVINCPARGLGDKFQELFIEFWDQQPLLNFREITAQLLAGKQLSPTRESAVRDFIHLIEHIPVDAPPTKIIESIITLTHYMQHLKHQYDQREAEERIDNVRELLRAAYHYEQMGIHTATALLEEIALVQERVLTDQNEETDRIQLMTLHAAKGLEFQTVILAGLEEGLLPSNRARLENAAIEEERRLFYVGITRAQERLLLTHAQHRATYGSMTEQLSSRFLREFSPRLCPEQEANSWSPFDMQTFFSDWFGTARPTLEHSTLTFGAASRTALADTARPHLTPSVKPHSVSRKPSSLFRTPARKHTQSISPTSGQAGSAGIMEQNQNEGHRWRIHQPVMHQKFGVGIVQQIDQKSDGTCILQIQFKSGTKKIADQFITQV